MSYNIEKLNAVLGLPWEGLGVQVSTPVHVYTRSFLSVNLHIFKF